MHRIRRCGGGGLSPEDFTGRAPQQVEEFLAEVIRPVLDANKEDLGQHVELNV